MSAERMYLASLTRRGRRLGQVGGHADLQPRRLARSRVEDVKVARLLVDHLARAGRGALDRETRVVGAPGDRLGLGVVRVEVELAVAIGEEVDGLADPHRLGVVAAAVRLGDLLVREVGELEHPDPRGRAAPVVLPLAEPLAQRRVGEVACRRARSPPCRRWGSAALWARPPRCRTVKNCECRRVKTARCEAKSTLPSGVKPRTMSSPGCQVRRFGSPPSTGIT